MGYYDTKDLRKRIKGQYDTLQEFADDVGISRAGLSLKLNNRVEISRDDMVKWGCKLNLSETDYVKLFLRPIT